MYPFLELLWNIKFDRWKNPGKNKVNLIVSKYIIPLIISLEPIAQLLGANVY